MTQPAPISSGPGRGRAASVLRTMSPLVSLLVVVGAFATAAPFTHTPLSVLDAQTIAIHAMGVAVCALGMTLVIVSGGIDLSVGSVVALASVAAAMTVHAGAPVLLAIAVAIVTGAACGLYNGLLIAWLGLPPFIATLGTLGFFRGVAKWTCGSIAVSADPGWLGRWVQPIPDPSWLMVAPGVWLMLILALIAAAALHVTVFGRHAVAIGSNEDAARRCAIPVRATKTMIYAVAGLFTGLAGALQFARMNQGDPTVSIGLELDVIAAVVIGGASLAGGSGSVAGTLAGATLMAFLRNRCAALGWPNYVQEMIVGHIIIIAIAADRWRPRSKWRG